VFVVGVAVAVGVAIDVGVVAGSVAKADGVTTVGVGIVRNDASYRLNKCNASTQFLASPRCGRIACYTSAMADAHR
jgi:hypothetical protein